MRKPIRWRKTCIAITGVCTAIAMTAIAVAQSGPPGPPPPPSPPPPPQDGGGAMDHPMDQPPASQPDEIDESTAAKGTVILHGGHDTDPRDRGRPVVLVAAGLNVSADVFRDAFSGVHPAGAGRSPTDSEARANKAVLMKALGPYGVTDQRINEVSNYYRYVRSRGELWTHRPAKLTAKIENGQVVGITIDDSGAGYTTPPQITVVGYPGITIESTLEFTTDLQKNGSIKTVTVKPTTKP